MAGSLLPGRHWNESQFQGGHGALCGPNALAMLESALGQSYANTLAAYTRMLAAKRCDTTGASTMDNLELQAHADGFTRTEHLGWNGVGYAESVWQAWVVSHLYAGAAILVETTNGQALHDLISGQGEDATNLQRHFFGVIGHNEGGNSPTLGRTVPYGFIATDGCNNALNPVVSGVRTRVLANTSILMYYPLATVAAARPGALLAIYPKPVAKPVAAASKPAPPLAVTTTVAATATTPPPQPSPLQQQVAKTLADLEALQTLLGGTHS